jgi:hypothetical protein
MRGDIARLGRCTSICTQGEDTIKRSKPFKYAYEKEIVMYVHSLHHPISSPNQLDVGTPTLRNWTTSLQSAYIPLTPTVVTPGHF